MQVEILNRIPMEELLAKVRQVPLLNPAEDGSQIFPYRNAHIELRRMNIMEVNPTTFYLIRKNFDFQKALRDAMKSQHGIDTLFLNEGLEIRVDGKDEAWTIMPPVVEVGTRSVRFHPQDGEIAYDGPDHVFKIQVNLLNDGAHRVSLAVCPEASGFFNAIYIVGADPNHPFYAHPNEWSRVRAVDSTPSTLEEKKLYSRPKDDCYVLYRDFGVLGCGKPRGLGSGNNSS